MSTIDINDVRGKIDEMLNAVERGETLAITRDGRAVALLEPAPRDGMKKMPSMAAFRASLGVAATSANSVVELRNQERF